jgi:streptogramin lyase
MNDLDRRLAESLKEVTRALRASRADRAVDARAELRRRFHRRRVTRFASLATTTAVVAAAAAVAATQGGDLLEGTRREPVVPAPAAGTYIRVGNDPVGVSVQGTTVWVASTGGTITRVSQSTNSSTAVINVGGRPTDIALTDDAVWYSDSADGTVKRLDIETPGNFVGTPLSIGSQGVHIDVDVGTKGTVWVASPDFGALIAFDPETGEQLRQILAASPIELAVARGSIWALADGGDTLVRYDFTSDTEALRAPLGGTQKTDMAATSSAVYVAEDDGTILRVDAATGDVTHRASVGGRAPQLALGRGSLWVASDQEGVDAELARLSLVDLTPVASARRFGGVPTDVALGDDSVWITETGRETVVRIETRPR